VSDEPGWNEALERVVRAYGTGLRAPGPEVDRAVMEAVRARGGAGAGRAAWRWFVEPVFRVRPALAAAAAVALIALSSAITLWVGGGKAGTMVGASATGTGTVLVRFELVAPDAHRVALAGSFNEWNDSTLVFTHGADPGLWTVTVALRPGEYQYMFVVDGRRWIPDPAAHAQVQDDFGQANSLLVVGPRGVVRS
jgi:hypothetical protein